MQVEETPRIPGSSVEWNQDFTFSPQLGFLPASDNVTSGGVGARDCNCAVTSPLDLSPLGPILSSFPCPIHSNSSPIDPAVGPLMADTYAKHSVSVTSFAASDASTPPSPVPASAFPLPPPLPCLPSPRRSRFSKPLPRLPSEWSDLCYSPFAQIQGARSRVRERTSLPTPSSPPDSAFRRNSSTRIVDTQYSTVGTPRRRPQSPFPLVGYRSNGLQIPLSNAFFHEADDSMEDRRVEYRDNVVHIRRQDTLMSTPESCPDARRPHTVAEHESCSQRHRSGPNLENIAVLERGAVGLWEPLGKV